VQRRDRARVARAHDHAVGAHEILHRGALLQELGIGRDRERNLRAARRELGCDGGLHAIGGADRDGGLVDHDLGASHPLPDVARGLDDVPHVGAAVLVRRRADCDELQRAMRDRRVEVGREPEPARGDVAPDHRFQPRLVDRYAAVVQDRDLARVDVDAQYVVADLGEARAGDETDVPGADHGDLHDAIAALIAASAATGSAACVIGRPMTR
jgi:hypothetical protein